MTEREVSKQNLKIRETEIRALNEELAASNGELTAMNEELSVTNKELVASNHHITRLNAKLRDSEIYLKQMVQNVAESEQRFKTMAEGTDVMIAVSDVTGAGTYFKNAWVKASGYADNELMKRGWINLIHPDDKERVLMIYKEALANYVTWECEF